MTNRASYIGTVVIVLTGLTACVAETQQLPSPTPVPKTLTPIPPTSTPEPPIVTPSPSTAEPTTPPTAEPTSPPIAITTLEDMSGDWIRKRPGKSDVDMGIYAQGLVVIGFIVNDAWIEDGLIYLREGEDEDFCSLDEIGIYEVQGVPGEYLIVTVVEDPCTVNQREFAGMWAKAPDG